MINKYSDRKYKVDLPSSAILPKEISMGRVSEIGRYNPTAKGSVISIPYTYPLTLNQNNNNPLLLSMLVVWGPTSSSSSVPVYIKCACVEKMAIIMFKGIVSNSLLPHHHVDLFSMLNIAA